MICCVIPYVSFLAFELSLQKKIAFKDLKWDFLALPLRWEGLHMAKETVCSANSVEGSERDI